MLWRLGLGCGRVVGGGMVLRGGGGGGGERAGYLLGRGGGR